MTPAGPDGCLHGIGRFSFEEGTVEYCLGELSSERLLMGYLSEAGGDIWVK